MVTPTLCTKCFVFPCVCGAQYKSLTQKQLSSLVSALANMESGSSTTLLKTIISEKELDHLPRRLYNYLFLKNTGKSVTEVWNDLENSNLLWKSCLYMFLSRFCQGNTAGSYHKLILGILERFNLPHYADVAKLLWCKDNNVDTVQMLFKFKELESSNTTDTKLIEPYVRIVAVSHIDASSAVMLSDSMSKILCQIGGVEHDPGTVDSNSFDIEDKIVFIDDDVSSIIRDSLVGDFDWLVVD